MTGMGGVPLGKPGSAFVTRDRAIEAETAIREWGHETA